ncbi:MAG: hypothetical protein ACRD2N_19650 [Vicinamibacterales bacterium]
MRIGGAIGLVFMLCLVAVPTWAQSNKVLRATGRVTAIAADSLTVQSGSASLTFAVDTQTKVEGKGVGTKTRAMRAEKKSPAITDFVGEADSVTVDYHDMGGGKLHAAKVSIRVKSFKK